MKYLNIIGYAAIVAAFVVHYACHGKDWEPVATFALAALGVIPLARLMGEATEVLSARAGATWGGLLNATFGNAAELIIAIIAMTKGLNDMVKASITGSIIGNLLLVSGAAMVAGGWRREAQLFNRKSAETNAGLLALAVAAMCVPAIFDVSATRLHDTQLRMHENQLSVATSVVLILVYALGLLFTLRTHRKVLSTTAATDEEFEGTPATEADGSPSHVTSHGPNWSIGFSVGMLLVASAAIAVVAELLVGSAEAVGHRMGWNAIFIGVILLAIVGNAAEHSTAILSAIKDDMDTAMAIAFQSSLQIALFAGPFLVLLSMAMVEFGIGHSTRLDLVFSPLEVIAVFLAVFTVIVVSINGETNWLEGAMLLGLYAILGIAFFYLPQAH